jgi:transposase
VKGEVMKQPNFAAMNPIVAKAIEQMMAEQGEEFSLEKINLAELERRTGISRQKLRSMKVNGFEDVPHAAKGRKSPATLLSGYTGILEALLKSGVSNSAVCFDRLKKSGYAGGLTTVKVYIASHQYLIPPQRHVVAPQGNRGRRYLTPPGEAFQMDWGFTRVQCFDGSEYNAACFAMVCHHCGQRFVEFFPNAKQENLFIGMIHAFRYMGIPKTVLTDNMKSVVIRRDQDGHPVWQKDYEQFMRTVGFQTKLCKPRHPFTKGKVERLVRFVKDNFLAGRVFWNVTDLNYDALEWCAEQNEAYHKNRGIPNDEHSKHCAEVVSKLDDSMELMLYLCPERRISFDGFVNYEGRRFGVPYSYAGKTARVLRDHDQLYIYSADLQQLLTMHNVTWSRHDSFCEDQYALPEQPEEFPTMPVNTVIKQLPGASVDISFEKFNFSKGDDWDD